MVSILLIAFAYLIMIPVMYFIVYGVNVKFNDVFRLEYDPEILAIFSCIWPLAIPLFTVIFFLEIIIKPACEWWHDKVEDFFQRRDS